jgi:hypothetical protein
MHEELLPFGSTYVLLHKFRSWEFGLSLNGSIINCDWQPALEWHPIISFTDWSDCVLVGTNVSVNGHLTMEMKFSLPDNLVSSYYVDMHTNLPVRLVYNETTTFTQMDFWDWNLGTPPASVFTLPSYNLSNCLF